MKFLFAKYHPRIIGSDNDGEQNTLHIMDDKFRIATRRIGDALRDSTPAIKYNIEDNLGSSNIMLDTTGAIVSREEYYPFGVFLWKEEIQVLWKKKDEASGLCATIAVNLSFLLTLEIPVFAGMTSENKYNITLKIV